MHPGANKLQNVASEGTPVRIDSIDDIKLRVEATQGRTVTVPRLCAKTVMLMVLAAYLLFLHRRVLT